MSSRQQPQPPRHPITRRAPRTTHAYDADTMADEADDDSEEAWPDTATRMPRSALPIQLVRGQQPSPPATEPWRAPNVPRRTHATTAPPPPASRPNQGLARLDRQQAPPPHTRRRWHPLFFVGLGLFIMVMGYLLFGAVSSWWQTTLDSWHYGYPRTYQTDAVVGDHDSVTSPSHFIAINLHSHVEVIEFPGGDVTHARVYLGPTLIGNGEDLAPVTLSFKDVNGDGKPDMLVSVGGTLAVFINDSGQFRPLKPGEQVTV